MRDDPRTRLILDEPQRVLRANEVAVVEAEDDGQIHGHGISNRIALFSTLRGGRNRRPAEYTGLIG